MNAREPYDFVPHPKGRRLDRRSPHGHHVLKGESGVLWCELEALSPLLVMGSNHRAGSGRHEVGRFDEDADFRPIIPGTSLKGMIRSVFEVLVPSCVALQGWNTEHLVPREIGQCKNRNQLCPACRTFGTLTNPPHKGCVNIGQARTVDQVRPKEEVQLIPMFGPNPKFNSSPNPMYGTDADSGGRKFYYHQRDIQTAENENDREYGPWVAPLPGRTGETPGATFRFKVAYENLEPYNLQGLVASLVLADKAPLGDSSVRVRHKLGYGKPAGLGSAGIRIQRAVRYAEDRYTSFERGEDVLEGEALRTWVASCQDRVFKKPTPEVQKLIEILQYPPLPETTFAYGEGLIA